MIKDTISIENAQIFSRNFSGKAGQYNPPGIRNFCVRLDLPHAKILEKDGWNVKYRDAREAGEEQLAFLQVKVNFSEDRRPPLIVLITSHNKTTLNEETVKRLDYAEIKNVDLIINPYNWEVNGKSGVKAYLKAMYVTIVEDEFAEKYKDIPDSAISSIDDEDD